MLGALVGGGSIFDKDSTRSIDGGPPNEVGVNCMDDNVDEVSAIGSASMHTPVALQVPIPVHEPVCNRTDHAWEEFNTKAYCI